MNIPCPQALPDRTLLNKRFAIKYFNKNVSPLGNCATFVGPWNGRKAGLSSANALHFLWEIPKQLSFKGIEINWLLLPSFASSIATHTGKMVDVVDNTIRVYSSEHNSEFGIVTCDVSSKLLIDATIGHIAFHIEPGDDCYPLSASVSGGSSTKSAQNIINQLAKQGIQSFYALTSRLFFTECIASDDI